MADADVEALIPETGRGDRPAPSVLILADDLIWSTRLADAVAAAGGEAIRLRRLSDLEARMAPPMGASHVVVDLTARAYDGVEAVRIAAASGARVIAVGQHDDAALRKAAVAAGAERVYSYRALFEHGPSTFATWLRG